MNAESLSVSNPSRPNGSTFRISSITSVTSTCPRTSSGAHSVQPLATSVSTNLCT